MAGSARKGIGARGGAALAQRRLRLAAAAFSTLPERYIGADPGFDATFQIRLGDVGRTWEVRARGERCEVRPPGGGDPDVVLGTDSATWLALRDGRLSGIDAFAQRRLHVRGDLDRALGFEGLFRLPNGRPPLLRMSTVEIAWRSSNPQRCSSAETRTGSCPPACPHRWPRRCPAPARGCCPSAGTCPRSSSPRAPTACSAG